MSSVPNNFGDTMVGTLKANEWQTLGTIYLPIALITWWGEGTPHVSAEEAACFLQVLKHTMCLISAVIIASKHFVSPSHSSGYLEQMSRNLSDLQTIHQVQISAHIIIFLYTYPTSSISLALLVASGPTLLKDLLVKYSIFWAITKLVCWADLITLCG